MARLHDNSDVVACGEIMREAKRGDYVATLQAATRLAQRYQRRQ